MYKYKYGTLIDVMGASLRTPTIRLRAHRLTEALKKKKKIARKYVDTVD
jgi:hypothetical protein